MNSSRLRLRSYSKAYSPVVILLCSTFHTTTPGQFIQKYPHIQIGDLLKHVCSLIEKVRSVPPPQARINRRFKEKN